MDFRVYFSLIDISIRILTIRPLGFQIYFLLCPQATISHLWISGSFSQAFNRQLKRNNDYTCSMDLRVYFLLFPKDFNRYLRRNINNQTPMDFRVHFSLIDIAEGILTIRPLGFQSLLPSFSSSFEWRNVNNKSSMDPVVYFLKPLIDI